MCKLILAIILSTTNIRVNTIFLGCIVSQNITLIINLKIIMLKTINKNIEKILRKHIAGI